MKYFILSLLIFAITTILSQRTISGIISSKNGPLEFVNILVQETKSGTTTNENGEFKITDLKKQVYNLKISFVGFEQQIIKVDLTDQDDNITIDLKEIKSLDEFVISATMKEVSRTESPVAVEVYSEKFFKTNPSPSLFESISNINGVRAQLNCNVCNTGDIHINGLEGSYTMILIDGMPIVSGLSSVYGLTGIPQSLIERIEIVKGPTSTLYGSEAIGGMINIITKSPEKADLFSADILSSDWGDVNLDLGFKTGKKDKFSTMIGVNYFNFQNIIDKNADNFTDLTLQNRLSVFNKWSFNRKNRRIFQFAVRYNYEDRWGGENDWTYAHRGGDVKYGESIFTNRWEVFGTYQLPTSENIFFQFSGNGHSQNSVYGNTAYIADQYVGFGQLYWNKNFGKHDLTSALVYRYTSYDDNTPATDQINITHLPGAFVQDDIKFNYQNRLLLGVRIDHNSVHGSIFTPRINYKWNSKNKNTTLRIGAGNGFRVVNVFTEDHAALTGARTLEFEGDLSPEKSYNVNVNFVQKVGLKKALMNFDVVSWYSFFNNKIIPDYETDVNKIIYSNLEGHAVSQGISLNIEYLHENGFRAIVGGTVMDVNITENSITERQILTENATGTFTLGYKFSKINLTVDYTGNVYGPMRLPLLGDMDNRPEYSPWFSIQNIQLTKKIKKQWEIYGGIKNILDYTPPINSIARPFDPFDNGVVFDANEQPVATQNNPNALTFDPSYVFASNQGIRGFLGVRFKIK